MQALGGNYKAKPVKQTIGKRLGTKTYSHSNHNSHPRRNTQGNSETVDHRLEKSLCWEVLASQACSEFGASLPM